jgi:hemerythrin-like domain-containing protein
MITDIHLGAAPAMERDAVDMLTACHQRIRSFTGIALRLAEAQGSGPAEVANAAAAVHRYYSIALPLHEADENESVYPRLRDVLTDAGEQRALQDMVEQHGPLNQVIARLLPRWDDLRGAPEKLPAVSAPLLADSRRLLELWNEHLALEEQAVFPLIRERLNPEALRDIHAEMKRRRGIE